MIVSELLSVKVGDDTDDIKNQFVGATIDPYEGFVVDTKGNIFISDTFNYRILLFSKEAKLSGFYTIKNKSSFLPESLCLTEDGRLYVHNSEKEEIIVFSPDRKALKSYNPASAFKYKYEQYHILSLSCNKMIVKVLFFINDLKIVTAYLDVYDQEFNLISKKIFYGNRGDIYEAMEKSIHGFERHFEDLYGNIYGYPLERDWIGKSLPLKMYSAQGVLLRTIDGPLLTRHTQYNVYDYYTKKVGLGEMKGKDFLIVNWHVTPSGSIYTLIANTEYVKVLKIEEHSRPAD
ncbi:MAG: hypothetical protein C4526_06575 [Nitrospiraceae bacterium]|nr:MAG: hypothetical protein C4526_06575 [Nitrospiraceae bacterium]